jgi:hypothetical protein
MPAPARDAVREPGLELPVPVPLLAVVAFLSLVPYSWHAAVRKMESVPFLLSSLALMGSYSWAAFRARRRDAEGARVLILAVLCVMATFPLTALARNYGVAALTRATVTLGAGPAWYRPCWRFFSSGSCWPNRAERASGRLPRPYSWPGARSASFTNPTTSHRARPLRRQGSGRSRPRPSTRLSARGEPARSRNQW